jgi:hypothetical protein
MNLGFKAHSTVASILSGNGHSDHVSACVWGQTQCLHCGNSVSNRFRLVCGDNNDQIRRRPGCDTFQTESWLSSWP